MMSRTVYMVLPPTVLLLDMAGPLEVLRVARRFGADFSVHVVAPTDVVDTSLPIQIAGLMPLPEQLNAGDLVIIAGAFDEDSAYRSPSAKAIVRFLKSVFDPAVHEVMSICSGAFLLGHAGLLHQRHCTTHHLLTEALKASFPSARALENRVFVQDGCVLSSAGITAGIDVTLHWLTQCYGVQVALETARYMNIYFRRSSGDSALSPWLLGRSHIHPAIHRVQDTIATNPTAAYPLDELARVAFVSPRHLSRLFKQHTGLTVHGYQLMLKHALYEQWQATGLNQEKSALAAGFSSAQAWRRSQAKQRR